MKGSPSSETISVLTTLNRFCEYPNLNWYAIKVVHMYTTHTHTHTLIEDSFVLNAEMFEAQLLPKCSAMLGILRLNMNLSRLESVVDMAIK